MGSHTTGSPLARPCLVKLKMLKLCQNISQLSVRRFVQLARAENVLVMNCGSSSIKFQVVDPVGERCLLAGQVDRLNSQKGKLKWKYQGETTAESIPIPDYKGVVEKIFGIVENVDFSYVGHRVVHGGEMFKEATVMDEENITKLSEISSLAPLHNPVQTEVIRLCQDRQVTEQGEASLTILCCAGTQPLGRAQC